MFLRRALGTACIILVLTATHAQAAAMQEIVSASEAAREVARRANEAANAAKAVAPSTGAVPAASSLELERLERALKRGEEINTSLRSDLAALERERAQLVQVQAILTSGLVGALVTAVVAVAGAVVTSRNSRPDRDLKRLAVLEKLRELQGAGVAVPSDIEVKYAPSKSEA